MSELKEIVEKCIITLDQRVMLDEKRYCGIGDTDNPCKYMLKPEGDVTLYHCANGRNPTEQVYNLQIEFMWGKNKG
jgi:hypothetical protein